MPRNWKTNVDVLSFDTVRADGDQVQLTIEFDAGDASDGRSILVEVRGGPGGDIQHTGYNDRGFMFECEFSVLRDLANCFAAAADAVAARRRKGSGR